MQRNMMAALTLLLSGRAMTLAFLSRIGGGNAGDPPTAWLMPLVGDAIIGLSALLVLFLLLQKRGLWVWTTIIVWNAVAIWDAFSAYAIHVSNPWPDFFMIRMLGSSMFFAAAAMHLIIILLAWQPTVREHFIG